MSLLPATSGKLERETPAKKPLQIFKAHTDAVIGIKHFPGGKQIVTCSAAGALRVWKLKNGSLAQIKRNWQDRQSPVNRIALSPNGKIVWAGSDDCAVRLWDVETGKMIAKWTGHDKRVWPICWSQDGQRVVSGSEDGTVIIWNVEDGETILGPINTGHQSLFAVIYSPNEAMITTSGYEEGGGLIRIWNAKTFALITTLKGHTGHVYCLAWTTDGKSLISSSSDRSIRIWNTTAWKQEAVLTDQTQPIRVITLSPNDRVLASASYDNTVRLWNLENGLLIGSPLQHANIVSCVSISGDGRLLATGCEDSNSYTWDMSAIVREAGFNNLHLDSNVLQDPLRSSILNADTNQGLSGKPLNNSRGLPQGFFDDTGDHIQSYPAQPHVHSSTRQLTALDSSTSLGFFSSLLHRSLLVLPYLSRHYGSDGRRYPPEINVPYTQGRARDVHAVQQSKDTHPTPNNIMTLDLSVPGASQPPVSHVMQQSSEPLHASLPDTTKKQTGRWTRLLCCVSPENAASPE